MSLAFFLEKSFACERGLSKKVMTQIVPNATFENGVTTNRVGILHVLLNILLISLLSGVHDTSGYFEMQKE